MIRGLSTGSIARDAIRRTPNPHLLRGKIALQNATGHDREMP